MKNTFSMSLFTEMPMIGIMRNVPDEHIDIIAEKYHEAGLTCLEITLNSPNAESNIKKLVNVYGHVLNIGAGTVCDMADLEKATTAGANFIVAPIINEEVIKVCVAEKIPIFPGAYTPSEIYKAWCLGATMVKLFPAGDLKPSYIKEVLGPLQQIKLLPTGGINLDNFTSYLGAGAKGVGIGSHLFPKHIIEQQNWTALSEVYSAFVKRYHDFMDGK